MKLNITNIELFLVNLTKYFSLEELEIKKR